MGILLAMWRRMFGGASSKYKIFTKRGFQAAFLMLLIFLYRFFVSSNSWYIALAIAVWTYVYFSKGHYYYFLCGTESDEYIDEQEAKGRKPAMNWIVEPLNKKLGFAPRSKQYCFIGMLVRYVSYSIPLSLMAGSQVFFAALLIPFIYNACFWIEFPTAWKMNSPTNWAEFFAGLVIGWSLM
jgi:hypothetical protein